MSLSTKAMAPISLIGNNSDLGVVMKRLAVIGIIDAFVNIFLALLLNGFYSINLMYEPMFSEDIFDQTTIIITLYVILLFFLIVTIFYFIQFIRFLGGVAGSINNIPLMHVFKYQIWFIFEVFLAFCVNFAAIYFRDIQIFWFLMVILFTIFITTFNLMYYWFKWGNEYVKNRKTTEAKSVKFGTIIIGIGEIPVMIMFILYSLGYISILGILTSGSIILFFIGLYITGTNLNKDTGEENVIQSEKEEIHFEQWKENKNEKVLEQKKEKICPNCGEHIALETQQCPLCKFKLE